MDTCDIIIIIIIIMVIISIVFIVAVLNSTLPAQASQWAAKQNTTQRM